MDETGDLARSQPPRVIDATKGFNKTPAAEFRKPVYPCPRKKIAENLPRLKWYVLKVVANTEFTVVDRLAQRRIFAFSPVNEVWRFWNGVDREKSRREFPAAPGYVVVGINPDLHFDPWANILSCEGVQSVLGIDPETGWPRQVSPDLVERIALLCTEAREVERFMHSKLEFKEGDEVRVRSGAYMGKQFVVERFIGYEAEILVEILGSERLARIHLGRLEKA